MLYSKGKLWVGVGDWHSNQKVCTLRKDNYLMHLASGKTDKQAITGAIKELRRLIKELEAIKKAPE